jgi:hypothetical protein
MTPRVEASSQIQKENKISHNGAYVGMTGNFQAALGQKSGGGSSLRRSEQSKSSSNLMASISLGGSPLILDLNS